jgi:hypothetical protein
MTCFDGFDTLHIPTPRGDVLTRVCTAIRKRT